ncbi:MAG: SDR family oxidoreductase [Candidatus Thioglobus sp.]|nr:SDR family oxidoreductase [Candidatus Thioglobus sp.]HJL80346.1 SDR family oxidoreductase [Gammaproteobacteria bacterium]HJN00207.1 SDR family oxidoreductase [Gammaproteobacteria bacterium]
MITGASAGIGAGVALAYAKEGAQVIVNYPNEQEEENARQVLSEVLAYSETSIILKADVSSPDQVSNMIDTAKEKFKTIDILVNNAGIATSAPVHEMETEMWTELLSIHLNGTFYCTRECLKIMYENNYGRIINTASQLAYKGSAGFSHYTAAKGAIISFTRSLSLEIGTKNIRANCVAPGATMTRMLSEVPNDILDGIKASIPKGTIADISDIIPAYVFLASSDGDHFVGQTISPNGGDHFL